MGTGKLTAIQCAKAKTRGMLGDGLGLYLQIGEGKSWILRYKRNGKTRWLGLGPFHTIGLAQAREKAAEARRLLLDGRDPIDEKRASRASLAAAMTFAEAAEAYMEAHRAGWRSAKHASQWRSTLATFVYPVIGDMPVAAVGVADLLLALTPIWQAKPVTAGRVRNRIELVLDSAKARGLRSGENPAAWRGHLDKLLPRQSKVRSIKHLAALPYHEVGSFLSELRQQSGPPSRALEFAILTATRSNETLGAKWNEVDLDAKVWVIPSSRMKSGKEHRVPLSDPALAIIAEMATIRMSDYVFPGRRGPLNHGIFSQKLKDHAITAHGFRSAFRDWAGNETTFPREVCEMALAHATGDATEQAYRRSDALDKRRELMSAWARHCERQGGNVVSLRSA
jgi:integrase